MNTEERLADLEAAHNDVSETAAEIQRILANYVLVLTRELDKHGALPSDVAQPLAAELVRAFQALQLERCLEQEDGDA